MFLIDGEREKELQRITDNLVAENITGCTQAASQQPDQMGCKMFTQLQVLKLFIPFVKQVYKHLDLHVTPLKIIKAAVFNKLFQSTAHIFVY